MYRYQSGFVRVRIISAAVRPSMTCFVAEPENYARGSAAQITGQITADFFTEMPNNDKMLGAY